MPSQDRPHLWHIQSSPPLLVLTTPLGNSVNSRHLRLEMAPEWFDLHFAILLLSTFWCIGWSCRVTVV